MHNPVPLYHRRAHVFAYEESTKKALRARMRASPSLLLEQPHRPVAL